MNTPHTTSYDEFPYEGTPFFKSHPDQLAVIGNLFGMNPIPVTNCRVLELGCGCGANIIPMASHLPGSEFIGVDLSRVHVDTANEIIKQAELSNITIKHASIMDIEDSWGKFDYIIAHGVYSWVPDEIQEKILSVSSNNLSSDGIVYISYNTYPGWHSRESIRNMMLFHCEQFSAPKEKVKHARALIEFLENSVSPNEEHYGMMLKTELKRIRKLKDYYLFHEYLEDINKPVYFHQFIKQARGHNLQYLGDASFGSMIASGLPENTKKILNKISTDILSSGQYLDFLCNKTFRSTLLCHKSQKINRNSSTFDLADIGVMLAEIPNERPKDFSPEAGYPLKNAMKATAIIHQPPVKAIISVLCDYYPQCIDTTTLFSEAEKKLSNTKWRINTNNTENIFRNILLNYYVSEFISFHTWQPDIVNKISKNPKVRKLAAYQACKGKSVVNLRHKSLLLNSFEKQLISTINECDDLNSLHKKLFSKVQDNTIIFRQKNITVTDPETLHKMVEEEIQQTLSKFAIIELLIS